VKITERGDMIVDKENSIYCSYCYSHILFNTTESKEYKEYMLHHLFEIFPVLREINDPGLNVNNATAIALGWIRQEKKKEKCDRERKRNRLAKMKVR